MENKKKQGNDLFKSGNFEEALTEYNEALLLVEDNDIKNKNLSILNSNISATYCKLDKYDKALEHAVSATKFRSDWHKAWYRLSFVLHKLDKNEQAKTAMDKTLECCQKENIQESYIEELKKCGNPIYRKNQHWEFIDTVKQPEHIDRHFKN